MPNFRATALVVAAGIKSYAAPTGAASYDETGRISKTQALTYCSNPNCSAHKGQTM